MGFSVRSAPRCYKQDKLGGAQLSSANQQSGSLVEDGLQPLSQM
jgi:hypothetical protein